MTAVPNDSLLPVTCPLCGSAVEEFHYQSDLEREWAQYECELVLVVNDSGCLEWDNQCELALPRWLESINKVIRAKSHSARTGTEQ